ncbi:MAG: DUF4156 domain-containing protein [Rhodanobacteraceae bacterium]|nr:DUF4156 domain-containing protein [Rhodanobacteraceae bacterium]
MKLASTAVIAMLLATSACTWVKLEPGAGAVRVAAADESMARCTFKGDITTTVTNRLAGVERNSIKVADELETLARNEAVALGANTIQPKGPPVAGEQSFTAHSCP